MAFDLLQWHFELFDTLHAANLHNSSSLFLSLSLSLFPTLSRSLSSCSLLTHYFEINVASFGRQAKRVAEEFLLCALFCRLTVFKLLINCPALILSLAHEYYSFWYTFSHFENYVSTRFQLRQSIIVGNF